MEQLVNSVNQGLKNPESVRLSTPIFQKYKLLSKGLFLQFCAGIEFDPKYKPYFQNLRESLGLSPDSNFGSIHFNGLQARQLEAQMYSGLTNIQNQYFQNNPTAYLDYQLALKNLDLQCAVDLIKSDDISGAKQLFDSNYSYLLSLPQSNFSEQLKNSWLTVLGSIWQADKSGIALKYLKDLSGYYIKQRKFAEAFAVMQSLPASLLNEVTNVRWSLWSNLAKIGSHLHASEKSVDEMIINSIEALAKANFSDAVKAKLYSYLYADAGVAYLNIGIHDKAQRFLDGSRAWMDNWLTINSENIPIEDVNAGITEIQCYQLENILKTADREKVLRPDRLLPIVELIDDTLERLLRSGNFITINKVLDFADRFQLYFEEQSLNSSLKLRSTLLKYSRYDSRPKEGNQISTPKFSFAM